MSFSARFERWLPWALVLAVTVAYLPSLRGGFLNYDDPWIIQHNPLLAERSLRALRAIWTDFSAPTRFVLGAEYHPIRDTSHWLEFLLMGHGIPQAMRIVQLGLYVGTVLLLREALHRVAEPPWAAELTAWLFALHPVHVESVAWLSGRKDVLAMLFVALALRVFVTHSKQRVWAVPLLLTAAILSKAMSIAAVCLLPVFDLIGRRRPDYRLYAWGAVPLLLFGLYYWVGKTVGMTTPPAGGSRFTAAATMGPVWLRYLGLSLWPPNLSVVHDVPIRTSWDFWAVAGWGLLTAWCVAGLSRAGRHGPVLFASFLCFVLPLTPVSQIVFPLQNLMADRYLYLSVLGPCLLASAGLARLSERWRLVGPVLALLAAASTFSRSALFADSILLFRDATNKTQTSGIAPYQLGKAYEDGGDSESAIRQYQTVINREPPSSEVARRATTNLAKLWARTGRLAEAETLLRPAVVHWPDDPRVLGNLAEVLARRGQTAEAKELFDQLVRRFPDYEWGRTRHRERFGTK